MGVPRDLIDKAHDRGILWLQTVGDVEGAEAALEAGADVLIAQGTEAGGKRGLDRHARARAADRRPGR